MKLIEALNIVQSQQAESPRRLRLFLACGFTPLHLQTFVRANLRVRLPNVLSEIRTGVFGDLIGSIEHLEPSEADALVVTLEWSDFDPRLGIRRLGGWRPQQLSEISVSAEAAAARLQHAIEAVSHHTTTILSLPTLPLPPAFATRPLQNSQHELQLCRIVAQLAESLSGCPGIRLLSSQRLAEISAPAARYDIRADLNTGFPYTLGHASAMGELIAGLVENRPPLKGLITDLDDTLWSGILGENGLDGVSWNLDDHSQMHGVYQQFVSSLAAAGVLVGVASKNDSGLVEQAFERPDLLLAKEDVFPFEVHWSSKAESIRRILNTWNIAADAAVFIDDSPAEVAEVQAAFPEMTCRVFPGNDTPSIWALLHELRDLFGKSVVTEEDLLRLHSIRSAGSWRKESGALQVPSDDFLRSAEARISFNCSRTGDARAFELVNKTNQFNLNSKRYSDSEWRQFLADPSAFRLTAAYEDKFGALGKIAVLLGTKRGDHVHVQTWVMSCRAFSRRIEHQCLRFLFVELGANRISFEYVPTPRNGPILDFLKSVTGPSLESPVSLTKELFCAEAPQLFHQVEVSVNA
jgi:FkbH-like protein